jgi:hypothetical protein
MENKKEAILSPETKQSIQNFWNRNVFRIIMMLGVIISFVHTSIYFNDFATGLLFGFVWFCTALLIDTVKAVSSGICLESLINLFTSNKKDEDAPREHILSRGFTTLLSTFVFIITLIISIKATQFALHLCNQNKQVENWKNSSVVSDLESLKKTRKKQEEALNSLTKTLNNAVEQDNEKSDTEIANKNSINTQIKEQKSIIATCNAKIKRAVSKKQGHYTQDMLKAEALRELKRLTEEKKNINVDVNTSQINIKEQSILLSKNLSETKKQIEAIESGKASNITDKTTKKTVLELENQDKEGSKGNLGGLGMEDFISYSLDLIAIFGSFMHQRRKRLSGETNDVFVNIFKPEPAFSQPEADIVEAYNYNEYSIPEVMHEEPICEEPAHEEYEEKDINCNFSGTNLTDCDIIEHVDDGMNYDLDSEEETTIDGVKSSELNLYIKTLYTHQ